jgi:hypothetical protein
MHPSAATKTSNESPASRRLDGKLPLTLERAREIFAQYRDEAGRLSMAHMYPYYRDDIRFRDSVQTIVGMEDFKAMGDRLLRRCSRGYEMRVHNAAQNGNVIFVHWTMIMRFQGTTEAAIDGTSILTLDEQGLIAEQRDHYDLWGDTFAVIPGLNKAYGWLLKKVMG